VFGFVLCFGSLFVYRFVFAPFCCFPSLSVFCFALFRVVVGLCVFALFCVHMIFVVGSFCFVHFLFFFLFCCLFFLLFLEHWELRLRISLLKQRPMPVSFFFNLVFSLSRHTTTKKKKDSGEEAMGRCVIGPWAATVDTFVVSSN